MRPLARVAIAAAILVAPAIARGDDTHYHDYPLGGRAVGLGGAFVAISDDTSGIYYNPAGLVDATRSSVSLSANLYGIEIASGKELASPNGESFSDLDSVFAALNIIPSSAGTITHFGAKDAQGRNQHSYGIGAFVPSYRTLNIQTSNDTNIYRRDLLDLEFYSAAAYSMRVDEVLRFGVSAVFDYRQLRDREETNSFQLGQSDAPFSTTQTNLDAFVGNLLLTMGVKAELSPVWFVGGSVTTPSIQIYEVSSLRVIQSTGPNQSSFLLDEPTVRASNKRGGNMRLGFAHIIPRQATFTGDIVLHAPVRYKLIELGASERAISQAVSIETQIERRFVANLNLGFETLFEKNLSIAFGFFTNLSSAPPIPEAKDNLLDRDYLPNVDEIGGTAVLGWYGEHTLNRIGLSFTYGQGHDVVPSQDSFRRISVSSLFLYAFVSGTFRY